MAHMVVLFFLQKVHESMEHKKGAKKVAGGRGSTARKDFLSHPPPSHLLLMLASRKDTTATYPS